MIISFDYGHGCGEDRGAEGYLNEEKVVREYGAKVVTKLRSLGHTLVDCTPSASLGLSLGQSLAYRVNASNNASAELHLCFHADAFEKDRAQGCEVEYISDNGKEYASKICSAITSMCGFSTHGEGVIYRPNLYVLKYTNAVAVLLEPFFIDTKTDCDKYNAETLATAIVKGVTGQVISDAPTPKPAEVTPKVPTYDLTIPANVYVIPGTSFYIEPRTDGGMGIHVDRGNYLTLHKGSAPDVYWNDNKGNGGSKTLK